MVARAEKVADGSRPMKKGPVRQDRGRDQGRRLGPRRAGPVPCGREGLCHEHPSGYDARAAGHRRVPPPLSGRALVPDDQVRPRRTPRQGPHPAAITPPRSRSSHPEVAGCCPFGSVTRPSPGRSFFSGATSSSTLPTGPQCQDGVTPRRDLLRPRVGCGTGETSTIQGGASQGAFAGAAKHANLVINAQMVGEIGKSDLGREPVTNARDLARKGNDVCANLDDDHIDG